MQRIWHLLLTLSLVAAPALARDSTRIDGRRPPAKPSFDEPSLFADLISDPLMWFLALVVVVCIAFLVLLAWSHWGITAKFKRTFGFPPEPRFYYKKSEIRKKLATLSGEELLRTEELAGICGYEDCTSIGGYSPPRE